MLEIIFNKLDVFLFMARNLCERCQRPLKACICYFICEINNKIPVLVLQHPSEVTQTKGTVTLLLQSLDDCHVLVGEDFSQNDKLNEILANYHALLLYPSEHSVELSLTSQLINPVYVNSSNQKPHLLIILDGTWKKAYRMFMLSKNLHSIKQICLPEVIANSGQYLIRKVAKKNALSSLEATCYALALLENDLIENQGVFTCGNYQPLINKFVQFNQFQLSFRP